MSIAQALLPEFDQEMANTRKALERIPEDRLNWKPDPKSMELGRLAGHITDMCVWGKTTLTTESLDIDVANFTPFVPTSRAQLLQQLDKNIAETRSALAATNDEAMMSTWKLSANGKEMFSMPKIAVLRGMVLNHLIHHRGQLMVYYRLTGVPVPGLYGPSADEAQGVAA